MANGLNGMRYTRTATIAASQEIGATIATAKKFRSDIQGTTMTFHTAFFGAMIIATVFIGSALVVDYTASCNGFGGGVRIVLGTPCR